LATRTESRWVDAQRLLLTVLGTVAIVASLWLAMPSQVPAPALSGRPQVDVDDYVDLRGRTESVSVAGGGNIFLGAPFADVREIVARDLARRSPGERAAIAVDVSSMTPRVNEVYPRALPLPTFPPMLLAALPVLPDGLEYRFMGDALIVMDADANLIVDILPHVLTP
jgi:hypothetical protein